MGVEFFKGVSEEHVPFGVVGDLLQIFLGNILGRDRFDDVVIIAEPLFQIGVHIVFDALQQFRVVERCIVRLLAVRSGIIGAAIRGIRRRLG